MLAYIPAPWILWERICGFHLDSAGQRGIASMVLLTTFSLTCFFSEEMVCPQGCASQLVSSIYIQAIYHHLWFTNIYKLSIIYIYKPSIIIHKMVVTSGIPLVIAASSLGISTWSMPALPNWPRCTFTAGRRAWRLACTLEPWGFFGILGKFCQGCVFFSGWSQRMSCWGMIYPLVNVYITMENHHF